MSLSMKHSTMRAGAVRVHGFTATCTQTRLFEFASFLAMQTQARTSMCTRIHINTCSVHGQQRAPYSTAGATTPHVTYMNTNTYSWPRADCRAPPAFNGGCEPHGYSVRMREVNGDEVLKEVWSGAPTSTKVKAQPATDYEVRVAAYNAVGAGTESAALYVSTPHAPAKTVAAARPPGVLAAPHVSVRGAHSAQVSWTSAGNNKFVLEMMNEKLDEEYHVCYTGTASSHEAKVFLFVCTCIAFVCMLVGVCACVSVILVSMHLKLMDAVHLQRHRG
jgi:hypothetical protein